MHELEHKTENKPVKGRLLVGAMALILGAGSLGVGVGVGGAVVNNLAPPAQVAEAFDPAINSVRINPLAVPINPTEATIADIIPKVKDAVVSISVIGGSNMPFARDMPGSGSGFIFYENEDTVFIATNHHVIENARRITISLDDNENVEAQVVGSAPESDLAVISVDREELKEKGVPYSIATFGDSDNMRMGDTVIAIGNAMGEGQTVTKGIVSAMDININVGDPGMRNMLSLNVMQTDAAVNRGNSGGPLLNARGEVIGVVTAKMMGSDIEGMGYALPINSAGATLMNLKSEGPVRQPFIGIHHEELSEFMRGLFNLPYSGLLIRHVLPDTPAEAAGLMVDDLIIYFDDTRIYGQASLVDVLQGQRPGDEIVVTVLRNGEYVTIDLTLGAMQHGN